jgi:hypothetical protein
MPRRKQLMTLTWWDPASLSILSTSHYCESCYNTVL